MGDSVLELPQRKRFATGVLGTYRKTLPKVLREESFFFFFFNSAIVSTQTFKYTKQEGRYGGLSVLYISISPVADYR